MKHFKIKLLIFSFLLFTISNNIIAQENIKLELISIDSTTVKEDKNYEIIRTVEGKIIGKFTHSKFFCENRYRPEYCELIWNNGDVIKLPPYQRIKIAADSSMFLLWDCDGKYRENPPFGNCGLYMYNRQGKIIRDLSDYYSRLSSVDISNNNYIFVSNREPETFEGFMNRIRIIDPKGNFILNKIIGNETERIFESKISPLGNYVAYKYSFNKNNEVYYGLYVINQKGDILFNTSAAFDDIQNRIKNFFFSSDEKYFFCDYLKGLTCYNDKFEKIWINNNISHFKAFNVITEKKLLLTLDAEKDNIPNSIKWVVSILNIRTGKIIDMDIFYNNNCCTINKNLLLNKDRIIITLDNIIIYYKLIYEKN